MKKVDFLFDEGDLVSLKVSAEAVFMVTALIYRNSGKYYVVTNGDFEGERAEYEIEKVSPKKRKMGLCNESKSCIVHEISSSGAYVCVDED